MVPPRIRDPDIIAKTVLSLYGSLPRKGKPVIRDNGHQEWTIVAGIVLSRENDEEEKVMECVALATGMRCLPRSKLSRNGDTLHDSHAEVLARRGFRVWLYEEAAKYRSSRTSDWIEECESRSPRFRLRKTVRVYFYVSTLPCGDASTLLLAQDNNTPQADSCKATFDPAYVSSIASALDPSRPDPQVSRGRLGFSNLGTLRTKPGRLDSPPSTSHCCSDKIALWNAIGLQGALGSEVFQDIFVDAYVFGVSETELSDKLGAELVLGELERALLRRVADKVGDRNTTISLSDLPFEFSRQAVSSRDAENNATIVSAVTCLSYIAGMGSEVVDTHGMKQGASAKSRKPNGALPRKNQSRLCKLELLNRHMSLVDDIAPPESTYYELKHSETFQRTSQYQKAKSALRGEGGPLQGWLVHGREWEGFDAEGVVAADTG